MQKIIETVIEKDFKINLPPCFVTKSEKDLVPLLKNMNKKYRLTIISQDTVLTRKATRKDRNGELSVERIPCEKIAEAINYAQSDPNNIHVLFFININLQKDTMAFRIATDRQIGSCIFPDNLKTAVSVIEKTKTPDPAELSRTAIIPKLLFCDP